MKITSARSVLTAATIVVVSLSAGCSSSGSGIGHATRSAVPRSRVDSTTRSRSSSPPTAFPSTSSSRTASDRPTIDRATSQATFTAALEHLPADTEYADYLDWDALGHPAEKDFSSIVNDGMTDRWDSIGIPAHSEQWSVSFTTADGGRGVMLHWQNPRVVAALVQALKAYHWTASGPASATRLTLVSYKDRKAIVFAFLGSEVLADTTSSTIVVSAEGDRLFAAARSSSLLSVARFRPLFDGLPQFASASLFFGTSAACARLPTQQPTPSKAYMQRYLDLVSPFHRVVATAAVMPAMTIPEYVHIIDPRHIDSDVFIQLADTAAAKADLVGRAAVAARVVDFIGHPSDLAVTGKDTMGPLDHYHVTGSNPVQLGQSTAGGYNACGTAG